MNWIGLLTMMRREIERTRRVAVQTILSPIISATLYIFVFGVVIGSRIESINGVPYITFVFPGILLLNIVRASYASSSSSLYFMRFSRGIEEILMTPFSYLEMIIGFVMGGIIRAVIVSVITLAVGLLFGAVTLVDPLQFLFFVIVTASVFSLIGVLIALWAESFEQLSVFDVFVLAPLTYLGGIFYSLTLLPELGVRLTTLNPLFYFVDGIRSSMIGVSEADTATTYVLAIALLAGLLVIVNYLFKIGWKIRY